jgi:hypothetical protein
MTTTADHIVRDVAERAFFHDAKPSAQAKLPTPRERRSSHDDIALKKVVRTWSLVDETRSRTDPGLRARLDTLREVRLPILLQ